MGKLLLAILSLGKFLPLGLSFLGPVGPILGAVVGFIGQVIKWFFDGLTVIVSHPATFVTVGLIGLGSYAGGIRTGMRWDARLVSAAKSETAEWKGAHQKLLDDAKKVDDADKSKHKAGLAAKAKAEADERAKIAAESTKPADTGGAAGVQPKPSRKAASCKNGGGQQSLFGALPVWAGGLPCKSI